MNTHRPRSSFFPGLRRRALAGAGAAILGAVAFTYPGEASASISAGSIAEWALEGAVKELAGEAVQYAIFGEQSDTLSSTDIALIKSTIDNALSTYLSAADVTALNGAADAAINDATTYKRGTTSGDLTNAYTKATGIVSECNQVLSKIAAQSSTVQYKLAPTYATLALLEVTFQKEVWDILAAQNALGANYSVGTASQAVLTYANAALAQLKTYKSEFDAQFSGAYISGKNITSSCTWTTKSGNTTTTCSCDEGPGTYCFDYTPVGGSKTTLCPTTDLSQSSSTTATSYYFTAWKCKSDSTYQPVTSGSDASAKGYGNVFRQRMIMKLRDEQLGSYFFEAMASLQKVASADVGYFGDGACTIAESRFISTSNKTPVDPSDCAYVGTSGSSTSTAKAYAVYPFGTVYTQSNGVAAASGTSLSTSSAGTLLTVDGVHLDWQSDGNLVLYSASGSVLWQTNTSGKANKLSLQSDGNFGLYNGSTGAWFADTSPYPLTSLTNRPVYLVLLGEVLYVVDGDWNVWWESDTDFHVYTDIAGSSAVTAVSSSASPRFCAIAGTQSVLASNSVHNLVWEHDGNLNVYQISGGSTVWTTNTANSGGTYLCNQDDGNLVVYDASYNELWSSGAGGGPVLYNFNGWGGDVLLDGSEVRVTAPSGDPIWSSATCAGSDTWDCSSTRSVASYAVPTSSSTCWNGGSTVLSNDDADLLFTSSGQLTIRDKTASATSPTTIWTTSASYPSGASAKKVCLSASGDLTFQYSYTVTTTICPLVGSCTTTVSVKTATAWDSGVSATGGKLVLAGCNLSINDSTTAAEYTTQTACSYGAYDNGTWVAN